LKVILEGDPCTILENEFVKPGKGQAFNRVRFRNLKTGRVWERTFKSGDSLEAADVLELNMEYLYSDGEFWHFMRTDGSFEQSAASAAAVEEARDWLKEQEVYQVTLWNDQIPPRAEPSPPSSPPAPPSRCRCSSMSGKCCASTPAKANTSAAPDPSPGGLNESGIR